MKKLMYSLLSIIVILLMGIYIAVNTPIVVDEAAKKFAPEYQITYTKISGNVVQGITIHAPAYKGRMLAKNITLRWNPVALFEKKILFSKVKIYDTRVDTLSNMVEELGAKDTKKTQSKEAFDFSINLEDIKISLLPFTRENIAFTQVVLEANDIIYDSYGFEIEDLDLNMDSNVTEVTLHGSYEDRELQINMLSLKDVDLPALQNVFGKMKETEDSNESAVEDEAVAWYIPEYIFVDQMDISVKHATFDPIKVQMLYLIGEKINLDLKKYIIKDAKVTLNAQTNLSNIVFQATFDDNTMKGKVAISPNRKLFELYDLPLRKEAIGTIVADIIANEDLIKADLKASGKQILVSKKGEFNFDVDSWLSNVEYRIKEKRLEADTSVKLSSPYTEDLVFTNHFEVNEQLNYHGKVEVKALKGLDENLTKLLKDIQVEYHGNEKDINTTMMSNYLNGSLVLQNFQKGMLKLLTKDAIMVPYLPETVEDKEVIFDLEVPFELDTDQRITADATLLSNIIQIDANLIVDKHVEVSGKIDLPDESTLRELDPNIMWEALVPFDINITVAENQVKSMLSKEDLILQVDYGLLDDQFTGLLSVGTLKADILGEIPKDIQLDATIGSMAILKETIGNYYRVGKLPDIEGSSKLKATLIDQNKIDLELISPQIIYRADRSTEHNIDNLALGIAMQENEVMIKHYDVTYNKQRVYASKPSLVSLTEETVELSPLWINDILALQGKYDLKTKQGNIDANATKMPIEHEWADLKCDIGLATVFDGNMTDVKGDIVLQEGRILYDVRQQTFASDSDIIIVQEMQNDENSTFMDNLSSVINIKTEKPLLFKQAGIDIKANADFTVYKAVQEPLMLLGSVELLEGGSYLFQDKKFTLEKSFIYFTGELKKPLLEIEAKYQAVKHLITISVTGIPEAPIINFSSSPSLTREQILSVILFDSEAGGDTYSGEEMMKMMGGAMAKSALANVGVQLDHLVLGEGNSIEVGKKLTRDITIIYINDEIPKVELKYRHTNRLESVLGASEESSSYDIIYTRDF